jgi:hypothetical protein
MVHQVAEKMEKKVFEVVVDDDLGEDYPTQLYAAIMKNDWEAALTECFNNPEQARTWVIKYAPPEEEGNDGNKEKKVLTSFLPLHAAMARNAPHQTSVAILMAYPEAVKEPDHRGMLPLHYACASGASEQRIAMLLMMYNQGARTIDTVENSLPIHQLCQRSAVSEESLRLLLIANPDSVDAKDVHGKTPLDIIAEIHGGEDAARLSKVFKLISLAIGMNIDAKVDQSRTVERISNLEKILKDEKLNREQEIDLLYSGIETLQVQADYLLSSNSSMEKQFLELQKAMTRVLGVQQETEVKLSDALSNVAKLQAEVGLLDQEKRNLEVCLNDIDSSEKARKKELSRLTDLLKIYSDCNTMLKYKAKSLNLEIAAKNEEVNEMSIKLNHCAESFDSFCQDVFVQLELIKKSANERELLFGELLSHEKSKNLAGIAESMKTKLQNVSIDMNDSHSPECLQNEFSNGDENDAKGGEHEQMMQEIIAEAKDEKSSDMQNILSPIKVRKEESHVVNLRSPPQ